MVARREGDVWYLESASKLEAPARLGDLLRRAASRTPDREGVPNTHRMLCSNQQMIAQCWPFLQDGDPLVMVDWLPRSHTFGGHHNFNMALFHAGTLFVEEGKPTDALVAASLRNLREVPPTLNSTCPRATPCSSRV